MKTLQEITKLYDDFCAENKDAFWDDDDKKAKRQNEKKRKYAKMLKDCKLFLESPVATEDSIIRMKSEVEFKIAKTWERLPEITEKVSSGTASKIRAAFKKDEGIGAMEAQLNVLNFILQDA